MTPPAPRRTKRGRRSTLRLLEFDPDLGAELDAEGLAAAQAHSQALTIDVNGPNWDPAAVCGAAQPAWLGLFVVNGLMIRDVSVGSRTACELFGPGDLIRPWDTDGEYAPVPISVHWRIPRTARLAVLDGRFAERMAAYPTVTSRILARVAGRARSLALSLAVSHLPRVDGRLLICFWFLAERWGTVGPDGITIALPLTHAILASLIGVRRPSVTLSLQRLARAELLVRPHGDRWLLTQAGVTHLHQPESLALTENGDGEAADATADH